jgi:sn-glycerol 3-phosphate transport system substrate-binding protein
VTEGGPVEIDLWYGGLAGSANDAMVAQAEAFNAAQDQVVLSIHNQGNAYEEVYRDFESASSSNPDQLPDAVYLQAEDFASTVDSGRVLPAQACMEASGYDITGIAPLARNYYTRDGVLQAGYMNTSNPVMYYNQAHWVRAGLDPGAPPTTLDEVHEAAQAIQDAGIADRPVVLKLDRWLFASWLNGVGVDVVDQSNGRSGEPTAATFATDEARELIERFQAMEEDGLLQVVPNEEGSIDQYLPLIEDDPGRAGSMTFETSTAATTIRDLLAGDLTVDDYADLSDIPEGELADRVPMAAQLPGIEQPGRIIPTGGAFYLMNTSDPAEQVAAWRFLEFMLAPENAVVWLTTGGYVPSVKAVLDDPDVRAYLAEDVAGLMTTEAVEQMQATDPDAPGPAMGPYIDFTDGFQGALEAVFLTGADAEDALADAAADVTAALERYYN